jgi:hypothetical protein
MTTDHSLEKLFSKRAWHKNTGIMASTARIYKKRFMENKLELETKMKILRASGYKLVHDMQWETDIDPEQVKIELTKKLLLNKAFWSYDSQSVSRLSDEVLIEKTLMHLDIEDISSLFRIFPGLTVKKVWNNKMLSQEPMYHALNRLYALLFFNIKNPDHYIHNFVISRNKHFHERIDQSD